MGLRCDSGCVTALLPISLLNPHKKFVVGRRRGRDGEKTAPAFSLRLSLASTPAANWASSPSTHYVCLLSHFSHICFCVTPWTAARQASQLMGFSRTGQWGMSWEWVPYPPPGDLPDLGSNLSLLPLLHWQVDSLQVASPGKPFHHHYWVNRTTVQ